MLLIPVVLRLSRKTRHCEFIHPSIIKKPNSPRRVFNTIQRIPTRPKPREGVRAHGQISLGGALEDGLVRWKISYRRQPPSCAPVALAARVRRSPAMILSPRASRRERRDLLEEWRASNGPRHSGLANVKIFSSGWASGCRPGRASRGAGRTHRRAASAQPSPQKS